MLRALPSSWQAVHHLVCVAVHHASWPDNRPAKGGREGRLTWPPSARSHISLAVPLNASLASATALFVRLRVSYVCDSVCLLCVLLVVSASAALTLVPSLPLPLSPSLRLSLPPSASLSPSASLLLAIALPLPLACAAERGGAGAGGDDGGADRGEGFWDDLRKCGLWW
jgi:hypothetical protein